MIIQLCTDITAGQFHILEEFLLGNGIKATQVTTKESTYLVAPSAMDLDLCTLDHLKGIRNAKVIASNYKLVSRNWKDEPTEIILEGGTSIGNHDFTIIAGPCSIESEEQVYDTVKNLVRNNIRIMRGGVFKPRSSPYAFRGLGIEGLKFFHKICKENNIMIISEVMQVSQIDEMMDYVDIFQVGARNAQNFNLLQALGSIDRPVMLKRGIAGSIEELLQSAEYVFSAGNERIILCERGIRTFENSYRNTFDINAIPILKEKSHLPVIADPSHGIGIRSHVSKIALAALVAGADGIITEIHPEPSKALSDGFQTLNFEEFDDLVLQVGKIRKVLVQ